MRIPIRKPTASRLAMAWLALAAAGLLAAPQTIKPGEVWPDDRGKHIQAHGGGIIKLGDTYYWFGEDRSQGLDRTKRYVGCYSSKDLAHWTFRNQVMQQADPENLGPRLDPGAPQGLLQREDQAVRDVHAHRRRADTGWPGSPWPSATRWTAITSI